MWRHTLLFFVARKTHTIVRRYQFRRYAELDEPSLFLFLYRKDYFANGRSQRRAQGSRIRECNRKRQSSRQASQGCIHCRRSCCGGRSCLLCRSTSWIYGRGKSNKQSLRCDRRSNNQHHDRDQKGWTRTPRISRHEPGH